MNIVQIEFSLTVDSSGKMSGHETQQPKPRLCYLPVVGNNWLITFYNHTFPVEDVEIPGEGALKSLEILRGNRRHC